MRTITFYSYKGGVGRTLAAANFAIYLAKLGLRTVLIDLDLEAPGEDAKFPLLDVPSDQKGILDYILDYQLSNDDSESINQVCLQVPFESSDDTTPLWLIPAGKYPSEEYYRKLSQLDWSFIFSEKRNGVAFFQQFLARINKELQADFVIVDSRTGISEISGLCTQQLADEVVMLSSLSSESIKVTKHVKRLIQQSKVAKALEKSIDVKIVVTRVPKPKDEDLEKFKERCCKLFETNESKLFFLFSSSILEQEEFLAIANPEKDEELVNNYVRLFYGLNIKLASEGIRNEINKIASNLLSVPPEESEKAILSLVALYPHPEVYRAAMHFFKFVKKVEGIKKFAWKIFDLMPDDEEAQHALAETYLSAGKNWRLKEQDKRNAVRVLEQMWRKGKLNYKEIVNYANLLEDLEQYSKCLEVTLPLSDDEQLDSITQIQIRLLAARSAFELGQKELLPELIEGIPPEQLDSSLSLIAVETRLAAEDVGGAYEVAKQVLQHDFSSSLLKQAINIARQLDCVEELEEELKSFKTLRQSYGRETNFYKELRSLGLSGLAEYLKMVVQK